jgi:hypothetical protein
MCKGWSAAWACVAMLGLGPMAFGDSPKADAFDVLNKAFRAAYGRGRAATLARIGPVILHEGDSVVLLRGGQRTEKEYMSPLYHHLKAVSHVPLAVFVLIEPYGYEPLTEAQVAEMRRYRGLVAAAQGALDGRGFSTEQRQRQEKILATSLAFLDGVLERRQANRQELADFTRHMGPPLLANAADAARVQLDALHAQVMAWRKDVPSEEWKRLRVVVMGSHMPRVGNLAMQYFAQLLGAPVDDRRLIYAEALYDEKRVLDLLGTSLLDSSVGRSFFGDDLRMHRDLLDEAAAAYVKTLAFPP